MAMEFLPLVGFLFLLLAAMAAVWECWISPGVAYWRLRRRGFSGPPPLFPLGNVRAMTGATASLGVGHDIHSGVFPYFARWRERYGKVFVYWLGTEPFLYIGEPEFLKEMVSGVEAKAWGKPDVFKRDREPLFGKGLVMVEGEEWAHHRHLIAPAFSPNNLKAMMGMMLESTNQMLENWATLVGSSKAEIEVERDLTENAAEVIAKTSFGMSHQHGQKLFKQLKSMQLLLFGSKRLVGVPFINYLHPFQTLAFKNLREKIDHLLHSLVKSRKAALAGRPGRVGAAGDDLLSLLIAGTHDGAGRLTTRELVDEFKTFFFGGHETTALALSWTLLVLAQHPEWQCKLREEIREVTGGEPLQFNMLAKLEKMGWVLNEALRLYPPAPNVQRQVRKEIKVGNLVIPKGTNVWIDLVGIHHDPDLWGQDVNEFKPERFAQGPCGGCKHRMGFLPFGFGGRMCIGRNLSIMEYKIVLTLILTKFSLSVSPLYSHSPAMMLTLRPSNGIHLTLEPLA